MTGRGCLVIAAVAVLLAAGGCAEDSVETSAQASAESGAAPAAAGATAGPSPSAAAAVFPMTVTNCGEQITIESPPQRVMLLGDSAAATLGAVGALDRVIARTGDIPVELYDEQVAEAVSAIPVVGSGQTDDGSGNVAISREEVVDTEPDLVIGYEFEGITRDSFAEVGIPMIILPYHCPDPADIPTTRSYAEIYDSIAMYGELFGSTAANPVIEQLQERVSAVEAEAQESGSGARTGAVLYVDATGFTTAYGSGSITTNQLASLGITNVFAEQRGRTLDIGPEALIGADPDVIVLLYLGLPPEQITEAFLATPGIEAMTAVREGALIPLTFELTEPPSPLTVDGLEELADQLDTDR